MMVESSVVPAIGQGHKAAWATTRVSRRTQALAQPFIAHVTHRMVGKLEATDREKAPKGRRRDMSAKFSVSDRK